MKTKSKTALVTGASSGIGEAAVSEVMRLDGRAASRLRLLRRFAPARLVDAGSRKDLQLDANAA